MEIICCGKREIGKGLFKKQLLLHSSLLLDCFCFKYVMNSWKSDDPVTSIRCSSFLDGISHYSTVVMGQMEMEGI